MQKEVETIPEMTSSQPLTLEVLQNQDVLNSASGVWKDLTLPNHPADDLRWLRVLAKGFGHRPILLRAKRGESVIGQLPLAKVQGPIFGKFLVGLPYLNSGGVKTDDESAAAMLIDKAIHLTDEHNCRYLELRHEEPRVNPGFNAELTTKIHMRLPLKENQEAQRAALKASVRNQVKKGEKQGFTIHWGGPELLNDFYQVFSRRMRDLGTPVYGRKFFAAILDEFQDSAEICSVRDGKKPVAVALLIHGSNVTEVPSASSLPEYNRTNANMLMYWNLLARSVERGQTIFDFGRSTIDGPTFKFKKQWGCQQEPATWQYYLREGSVEDMRPDSGKKKILIELWKRLPVWLANIIGPWIVKGIP